jgi:acyl-CoA thioesterase-1
MLKKIISVTLLAGLLVSVKVGGTENDKPEKRKIKIVCLGDSITRAKRVKPEESFIGILEKKFRDGEYPVEFENDGVGGDTTAGGIRRLEQGILARKPDIVIVMFGCNDSYKTPKMTKSRIPLAQYRKNLETILELLKNHGIKAILMTTIPTRTPNNIVEPYVEAVRDIAKAGNIPLVDNFKAWEEYQKAGNKLDKVLFDIAHPNQAGYIIMAESMYPVVLDVIKNLETEDVPKNIAFGKKYSCSDEHPSPEWHAGLTDGAKSAADADKKKGGFASGSSPNFPKSVTIDLDGSFKVGRVLLYNMKKYGVKTVEVSLSDDGENFKKVGSQEFKKADGRVYEYKFPQEKAAFVRITFVDYYKTGLNPNYMFLREAEVYEK